MHQQDKQTRNINTRQAAKQANRHVDISIVDKYTRRKADKYEGTS